MLQNANVYVIRIFYCIVDNAITMLKKLCIFIADGDDFYEPFIDADIYLFLVWH